MNVSIVAVLVAVARIPVCYVERYVKLFFMVKSTTEGLKVYRPIQKSVIMKRKKKAASEFLAESLRFVALNGFRKNRIADLIVRSVQNGL